MKRIANVSFQGGGQFSRVRRFVSAILDKQGVTATDGFRSRPEGSCGLEEFSAGFDQISLGVVQPGGLNSSEPDSPRYDKRDASD